MSSAAKKSIIGVISEVILGLRNKVKIFMVVGLALVVGLISMKMFARFELNESNKMSSDKLSEACAFFALGDVKNGFVLIDEVISRFPRTAAACQARLFKADAFIEMCKYNEALKILQEILNSEELETMRSLADARIIYLYDSKKDYPKAIFASSEFIKKYPNHFLTRDIYLNLAEYCFFFGFKEDAIRIFNEVVIRFPNTREAKNAQSRLNGMKNKLESKEVFV
ncbi:MAG: tetratricopeptide repeat protein [Endomicrobium sp.]|nr:tetratricopeptide repeat protein [Endomicrobium sp.]